MKIAIVKGGIQGAQIHFNKDVSDSYIRTIIKEKTPSWELISIISLGS